MIIQRAVFFRFAILYAALFSAFGSASPFLPAFLAEQGLGEKKPAACRRGKVGELSGPRRSEGSTRP
jgi:hypothetical protein